ncbi:MAG: DUF2723 domain-containing protein [Gemmatimonadetes bacterium]|nr:DUF2723 domain-containing protein [Gemmatimonadota bacterium]
MKQSELETVLGAEPAAEPVYRPPYLAATLAGVAVFVLYALTLARTTAFWDTSEYIATAHILGVPHPPGNPTFVVLARAWELLLAPLGLSTAVRINLFSAFMSAAAHACWFLLADRILAAYSLDRTFRLVGAAVAVLISATAFTVWNQSNVNEKVYSVSFFTIALLSWLAFHWRDNLGRGKDDNLLLLMFFILALSVGNHLMAFLAAPALLLFILLVDRHTLYNWKLYPVALLVIVLGLSIHLFLPIRAQLKPVINEADPQCESLGGAVTSVLTLGRKGCPALSESLSRTQYDKPSMFSDPISAAQYVSKPRSGSLLVAQVANYIQYFDWQWARSVAGNLSWFGGLRPLFTLLFVLLGAAGAWTHWRRDKSSWAFFAVLFVTVSLGLTFYLNFKYGYTYPPANGQNTEVRERDYFFMVSFSLWGLWAGIGLMAAWQWLSDRVAGTVTALAEAKHALRPSLLTAPVLALALIPLFANWSWASRAKDYAARDWAYNLLNSVEPYGVLFTNGDNDTFPLWYLQEVEGIRQDVTVIVMSYLNTPWYAKQLRDLSTPCPAGRSPADDPTRIICQRPYHAGDGPPEYAALAQQGDSAAGPAGPRRGGAPTRTILPLTDRQIDEVAGTAPFQTAESQVFRAGRGPGGIETVVPAGTVIVPADIFLAQIVSAALEDRPIYFAMTTAAYENLKLYPFLIRQGVAFKLHDGPLREDTVRGIRRIPSELLPRQLGSLMGPFMDVPRTEELLSKVFVHSHGFPDEWGHWVDSATDGSPAYYAYTHLGLAAVYQAMGDTTRSRIHQGQTERFLRLANVRTDAVAAANR